MGRVRKYDFDAVIGVGGIGSEPRAHGIDGKITWVGVNPIRKPSVGATASIVTFEHFILWDSHGPYLHSIAPALSRRMYEGKARVLLAGYTPEELAEAHGIVEWALREHSGSATLAKGNSVRGVSAGSKRACGASKQRGRY